MQTQDAYNNWAKTYDTVINKTRDLEAIAIRTVLTRPLYDNILELGCGTGKNTGWLAQRCNLLIATDFSEAMMNTAREKVTDPRIHFRQADITQPWSFGKVDLITCSLVLEHIKDLHFIFAEAVRTLLQGGLFYICELHPYKQISGSRAKFEQDGELHHLEYFVHHISDYCKAAADNGFTCHDLQEWFDDGDRDTVPRLVSYIFSKN